MFLHLGEDISVSQRSIVGIFNLEGPDNIADNNTFLKVNQEDGFVFKIGNDRPKSFILCHMDGKPLIYLSPISASTLNKRSRKYSKYQGFTRGGKNGRK